MTRTQYKRRTLAYWVLLAVYAIVLSVAVFYAWGLARSYAIEYENSQSDTVVNAYIENLNEEHWNDKMEEAAGKLANNFQDASECAQLVRDSLTGDIQLAKINSPDFSRLQYYIMCNDREIGKVSFVEDVSKEKSVKFGRLPWIMEEESFNFDYMVNGSASAVIPATYSLKLNGVEVGEEYITERDIPYDVIKEYYSEYQGLPTKVKYEISGLVGNLTPVVYNESGEEFTIDENSNDSQFLEPCPPEKMSRLQGFAEEFVGPYARFTGTKNFDTTFPELRKYVKPGSDLADRMQQFYEGGSTWMHWNSCVVSDFSFNGAYSLGGNFYVIDVSYKTTNYADYKTVEEDNIKRIVVVDNGSEILAISVE